MDRLIYQNGDIVEVAEARVPATAAGLLYGWGVFTTMRVIGGSVFAFDRHFERLIQHAEKARVEVPIDFESASNAAVSLIEANSVSEGRMRLTILKEAVGTWGANRKTGAAVLIFTSSRPVGSRAEVALTVSPYRIFSRSPLSGVKRTAMLENLLAFEEARSRGFTEAVMLNERGEVVSASSANIFWVEAGELHTPSAATGCVAGVTRGFVQEIADRANLHIVEGGFPLQSLLDASEVFLTSTISEISPASSFDLKHYDRQEARLTPHIIREFKKLTRNAKIKTGSS